MIKTCEYCDSDFTTSDGRKRFCNMSCSASFNNKGVRRHGKKPGDCETCGKRLDSYRKRYCSHNCFQEKQRQTKIDKWKSGEWNPTLKDGSLSNIVRDHLLEQAEYKCTRCGWGEVNPLVSHGHPILTVDHIDGDWKNNSPENLRVLCYNCHTLTPTFGSLSSNGMSKERMGRI